MAKVTKALSSILSVLAFIPGPQQPFVQAGAALMGVASALLAKKPAVTGSQTQWRADPSAPVPVLFGRTGASGYIAYKKSHGKNQKYDSVVTVYSGCGPIESFDTVIADKVTVPFSGAEPSSGFYLNRWWKDEQLGLCPEAAQLSTGIDTPPGWGSSHKLSGLAASMDTFEFDGKGDNTFTSLPTVQRVGHWVKLYDAREDDTYDGGSGPQRSDDETTRVWGENPFAGAVSWALGWHQGPNDVRVGGVGMPVEGIDLAAFVDASNVADANGWTFGGEVTTRDNKWEVLKAMCQAGGGEPVRHGALLSCIVNTPRVPIGTITVADLIGSASITTAQTRRDRINGVIPRYRSEDHYWEEVPASVVRNTTYLAEDGGRERTKEIRYSLVQCPAGENPTQAAQLAAYDVANGREAGPIVLPLKLRWLGLRAGDCLTIDNDPSFGWLAGRDILVMRRSLDPATGAVTITARTETASKHAWALSQTGVAAPVDTPPVSPDAVPPEEGEWSLDGTTIEGDGSVFPALVFEGATDDPTVTGVIFSYYQGEEPPATDAGWITTGVLPNATTRHEVSSVGAGLPYMGAVQYVYEIGTSARLPLGPVTTGIYDPDAPEFLAYEGELLTYDGSYLTEG